MTFDSDVGLAEQLINAEVIHFGIGSPENGQLFIVRLKFHRGPYMDQLLYRVHLLGILYVVMLLSLFYRGP